MGGPTGDVPLVMGYWTGAKGDNGDWAFTTRADLTTQPTTGWPTPADIMLDTASATLLLSTNRLHPGLAAACVGGGQRRVV